MFGMLPAAITARNLPVELEALQAFALEQNRCPWVWREKLERLQHQIAQLNRASFGARFERVAAQAELFDATVPVLPEPAKIQVTGHTRKGRPALPKDLPRTRIEYDLSDEQKAAFDALERIGNERGETLHYEPFRLTVSERIRFEYAAKRHASASLLTKPLGQHLRLSSPVESAGDALCARWYLPAAGHAVRMEAGRSRIARCAYASAACASVAATAHARRRHDTAFA